MSESESSQQLVAAEAALGLNFQDHTLLSRALTHPSADSRPAGALRSNQRLEFLGDRVLGLIIADQLYKTFPDETEGALARRFAVLVSKPALTEVARRLDLGAHLVLGRGEAAGDGRDNAASLADACEAVIGALYLDGGFDAAAGFVVREWASMIEGQTAPPRDPKTELQEWAQARGLGLPIYELVERTGPAHAPTFEISVNLADNPPVKGLGPSKRQAERAAAAKLLAALDAHG